jgi:hypothetical protein
MLCIAYLALFAACLTYPVLVAVGSVRDALLSSLIALPPSLIVVFIAAFFGVEAVAAAALLSLPYQAAIAIYFVSKRLAIGTGDLFAAIRKSGIVTTFSITGPVAAAAMVHAGLVGPLSGLFLAGTTAATGWLLGLIATDHPLLAQLRSAMRGLPLGSPRSLVVGDASIRSLEEKPPR